MGFTVSLCANPFLSPVMKDNVSFDLDDDGTVLAVDGHCSAIATAATMMHANGNAPQFVPALATYMLPTGTTKLYVRKATEEEATANRAVSYLTRKELLTLLANTLQALEDTAAVVASSLAQVDADRAAYYADGVAAAKRKRLAVLTALAQLNE